MNYITSLIKILSHPLNRNYYLKTLVRVVTWKINQFTFKKPLIVEIEKGIRCLCYPDSAFGSLIVYMKLPEYQEMKFALKVIEEDSIFIDVGANIGIYSLLAASKIKSGKVYAFEPVNKVILNFKENIRLNNFGSKVSVFNKVISEKSGKEPYVFEKVSEISAIGSGKTGNHSLVKSMSLDDFISKEKIKNIDFLKIDVEGAEMKVLSGARRLLSEGWIKYLLLEVNKKSVRYGYVPSDLVNYLNKFGYKTFKFTEKGLRVIKEIKENVDTFNLLALKGKI